VRLNVFVEVGAYRISGKQLLMLRCGNTGKNICPAVFETDVKLGLVRVVPYTFDVG
jgi:hypothetical protein